MSESKCKVYTVDCLTHLWHITERLEKKLPHSLQFVSFLLLYLLWFLWISLALSFSLLKTVSALLLLHQKAVAKWRLTSAAATEEGLCVFSSWGQIPLKRAKLWTTISHCNENPCVEKLNLSFSITHFALYIMIYSNSVRENYKLWVILGKKAVGPSPPPATLSLLRYCLSISYSQ